MGHPDELRVRAVALLAANGGNVSATAEEIGVARSTVRAWYAAMRPHLAPAIVAMAEAPRPPATPIATLAEKSPLDADAVAREIGYIGFGNLSDVVSWGEDGRLTLTPSDQLTPAQAAIISEIRCKRRRTVEADELWEIEEISIKTRDKLSALKFLGEAVGLVHRGSEINVDARQQSITLPAGMTEDQLLALARSRAAER